MSILVVAAHPDDEVLGCAGTIAKLSRTEEVHIAILGEGITSRFADRSEVDPTQLNAIKRHAEAAAAIVGALTVSFEDLPDNRFDTIPLLEIIKRVERLVATHLPHTVFTHHPGDLNIDHQTTFRAVLTATRPLASTSVRNLYSFEIASSTEWAFQRYGAFKPNYFIDVAETLEQKIDALRCYGDEMKDFPHPRSVDALLAIARRWGAVVGVHAAEAFEVIRVLA